jgi:hypothetical protein
MLSLQQQQQQQLLQPRDIEMKYKSYHELDLFSLVAYLSDF